MEGLAELLILLLFLLGPILVGYLVAHLYPIERLQVLCGAMLSSEQVSPDVLRQMLRVALSAPASASDLDLLGEIVDLRRAAERTPAPPKEPR